MLKLTQLYIFAAGKLGEAKNLYLPSKDFDTQFKDVMYLIYAVAGVIAVIVIIVAGIQFSLAGGNPQTVSKAKNAIIYSLVGLIVVASAFMITNFVMGRF